MRGENRKFRTTEQLTRLQVLEGLKKLWTNSPNPGLTRSSSSTSSLNPSLCQVLFWPCWILDFLTGRPQSVRIGNSLSSTTTLSTGAPQGCVLSPLLFTLLTHECAAMHSLNHVIKFADDATVVGLISKNDESACREEVQRLTAWCRANNLSLNVDKTKEIVVNFRRAQSDHSLLFIDGSPVEIVKSTKFLGVYLVENFTWSLNTSSISKKAQQRLYFVRRLGKAHLPPPILTMFYRGTIESILSSCITAWFGNCTVSDRKILQRIVRTAEKIIRVSLPSITDIYSTRCIRKANSISTRATPSCVSLHVFHLHVLVYTCYTFMCYVYTCYTFMCYVYTCYTFMCYVYTCYTFMCYVYTCYTFMCYSILWIWNTSLHSLVVIFSFIQENNFWILDKRVTPLLLFLFWRN
ncbi:hypothetical protein QTP70_011155 [Hemibagrus guttatus]|uniref:Reverse transcriptase domain-containing protein n=1 Tax=Hemibagrus guttatus TaxID=175788 RepID=A0AAE0RG60_9TELE|nr:hypothetical protein QTP70_011155 [Hemibagrus guttatus]